MRHLEPLQGALEAFARRALYDPNAVADVLQSAIAVAFRDFHLFTEGTNFRAWIFRFVHLEILTNNRKRRRNRAASLTAEVATEDVWELALEEPLFRELLRDPGPVLDRCDDALARAIGELSSSERDVLLLRAIGEFKYREIAEILRIPLGTVMSNLARSRSRLRRQLVEFGNKSRKLGRETT